MAFGYGGRTYWVLGYAPAGRFARYDAPFRQVLGSFAPLTDPALLAVRPNRLQIVRLAVPTTPAELSRRAKGVVTPNVLATINQVPSAATPVPAGTLAKTVAPGGSARRLREPRGTPCGKRCGTS